MKATSGAAMLPWDDTQDIDVLVCRQCVLRLKKEGVKFVSEGGGCDSQDAND
jgi:hypothetical protein